MKAESTKNKMFHLNYSEHDEFMLKEIRRIHKFDNCSEALRYLLREAYLKIDKREELK